MVSGPLQSRLHSGVVTQAGKLLKTIKVRVPKQTWNKRIQKYFSTPIDHLVSDPTSSAREGDIVKIASGWRVTKNIRHCLHSIVSPFGTPVTDRPAVPTVAEREATKAKARLLKDIRQAERGRLPSQQRVNVARTAGRFEEWGVEDPSKRKAEGRRRDEEMMRQVWGEEWKGEFEKVKEAHGKNWREVLDHAREEKFGKNWREVFETKRKTAVEQGIRS